MDRQQHLRAMLDWWAAADLHRTDLAVRRHGAMVRHCDVIASERLLRWAAALNARSGEVYIRPARGYAWPVILLDDLDRALALRIAAKYGALVVHTSPEGGCQLWLRCSYPLAEAQRRTAQRWLARRCTSDPASTSGEHFGRLAGHRNWKRAGCWVDVLRSSTTRAWDPTIALQDSAPQSGAPAPQRSPAAALDRSASAQEWGWVCGLLEAGESSSVVQDRLSHAARQRRGPDAERYALHTVRQACQHLERRQ